MLIVITTRTVMIMTTMMMMMTLMHSMTSVGHHPLTDVTVRIHLNRGQGHDRVQGGSGCVPGSWNTCERRHRHQTDVLMLKRKGMNGTTDLCRIH